MDELERILSQLFLDKMPPVSENVKNGAVKYLPWAMIILGALGLLAVISIVGMFKFSSLVTQGAVGQVVMPTLSVFDLLIVYIVAPVTQVANIVAGYWMLGRQLRGWRLALLALLLGLISNLINFSLFGLLLNFFFTYLLFQIRNQYRA